MNPSISSSISSQSSSSSPATSWLSGIVGFRRTPSILNMSGNSAVAVSASADVTGPVVHKNQLRGALFKYGPNPIQVAFKSGEFKRQVIFIGGLTDGFLATAIFDSGNNDMNNAKVQTCEFKNMPKGWETILKYQDGNIWEMSQREEDILMQEFERRIAYSKFQIASFIETLIFSWRRPIDVALEVMFANHGGFDCNKQKGKRCGDIACYVIHIPINQLKS